MQDHQKIGDAVDTVNRMRSLYDSGDTRSYSFRRDRLLELKAAVIKYEKKIAGALFADLHKGPEEAYATETGLVLAEINLTLSKLRRWMRPQRVPTNLANLPSTSKILRDPLGVVLIVAPWNYPFMLTILPLIGAIAGGNVAVLKPSELAVATAVLLDEMIGETFDRDYVHVVQGDGAAIVPSLMKAFRFDHIFYTGNPAVGRAIYQQAAADLVGVTLELGGKSPAIVEADANLKIAARRIALGKYINSGQTCVAADFVLVHQLVADRFVEYMKQTIESFFGKNPAESPSYGRIIHERRFDKLVSFLDQGEIVFGGQHNRADRYIAPTLIRNVPPDAPIMGEEIFGPILPVFSFRTREEAAAIIARHPNPLAFYLFTADRGTEKYWIEETAFGGGCVNNTGWQFANPHLPFGGLGNSGIGSYHGKFSFESFTRPKAVMKTPLWIDPAIKYPPFAGKINWFKRLIR